MSLFTNDPPIEQWFRDLFGDLVESFPGVTKAMSRMPKYWHSLHGIKPEALEKAFLRATEICEFFPSVPKILEIQGQGGGSQPYKRKQETPDDDRGPYPPFNSEAHNISRQVLASIRNALTACEGKSPEEKERVWAECRAYQDEMRPKYREAMANINSDTGQEFEDKIPF